MWLFRLGLRPLSRPLRWRPMSPCGTLAAFAVGLTLSSTALAASKPPIAVPASALSTTGATTSSNIVGSSAAPVGCSGYEQVTWDQNTSQIWDYYAYPHGITMSCNPSLMEYSSFISYIQMSCSTKMFFLGGLVPDGNGHDTYSGQNQCHDWGYFSPGQFYLVGDPFVHNVVVTLTIVPSNPSQPVVWDTNNNGAVGAFCSQGGGTATLTCTDNVVDTSGNPSLKGY